MEKLHWGSLERALEGWLDLKWNVVIKWVHFFQSELMVEIYSKSLVRANGKVLLMKFR